MTAKAMTALTAAKITKPGAHRDSGDGAAVGLYLQVSEAERRRVKDAAHGVTKSWIFRFTSPVTGKPRWMGLGPIDVIGLAKARELAKDARLKVKLGLDPIEERLRERDERRAKAKENIAFKDAAEKFIDLHAPTWKNKKHREQWRSTLKAYVYPTLGGRPISAIDGALITEALAPIWTTKQETAHRVKQRIQRVVQWVKDGMPLPHLGASKRVKHHPAMPFVDLPAFMVRLRERQSISARALELTILTAARTADTIGAQWKEIDLEAGIWRVDDAPVNESGQGRHKSGKEFEIPLSTRAIEILTDLPRVPGGYVFPGAKPKKPLSEDAMLKMLQGMKDCEGFTVHGFRSSFRDWAGDRTNFAREVIEAAMSHRIKDKAEAAYRRSAALEKRRKLMEAWAAYCMAPPSEGKVLSFGGARG